jgi:hypothetical protein
MCFPALDFDCRNYLALATDQHDMKRHNHGSDIPKTFPQHIAVILMDSSLVLY